MGPASTWTSQYLPSFPDWANLWSDSLDIHSTVSPFPRLFISQEVLLRGLVDIIFLFIVFPFLFSLHFRLQHHLLPCLSALIALKNPPLLPLHLINLDLLHCKYSQPLVVVLGLPHSVVNRLWSSLPLTLERRFTAMLSPSVRTSRSVPSVAERKQGMNQISQAKINPEIPNQLAHCPLPPNSPRKQPPRSPTIKLRYVFSYLYTSFTAIIDDHVT